MPDLDNKKILLGITGGIAAYKAAEYCRLLIKQGARVRVVMTPAAKEFIQPLTFQALTGEPVLSELFDADAANAMDHIELARWADLIVVAPASADSIAKLADGYADNLLLTIVLAASCPVAVAPAMNQHMWSNQATQDNIQRLRQHALLVWGPAAGEQACGDVGEGRMLEPQQLADMSVALFRPGPLTGRKLMITAGPTREAIDPVRFLSNRSSGKMGYALAAAARDAGAEVTLVSGPVCLNVPDSVTLLSCESAGDMLQQVTQNITGQDIFIACAAVADYRVAAVAKEKIKKTAEQMTLQLVKTPDILASVSLSDNKPFCVGFAAETSELEQYARHKLAHKKLDMIAANRVDDPASGFEVDDNALAVFWQGGSQQLPRQPKTDLARELIAIIARVYREARPVTEKT
ncbi:MAG: bifunctional phosphopantothenoylcysteine decarboxylase/phosphopantothenate--cysteine ligase CoaBC [Gammaproteobacteria bacterium]|nr:bifunctional phosphopantothenoylcysteine decarboxylase/phosphopantothenate--cysteine ligase CoaBC [Gammaproteobacteria bacterium]